MNETHHATGTAVALAATLGVSMLAPLCSAWADEARRDGAVAAAIAASGSLQNPAWSPDGRSILLTRFRRGYNEGPADLLIHDLDTGATRVLVGDGGANISLPGSAWNGAAGIIAFSSDRGEHDDIYVIAWDGAPGSERRVTSRVDRQAYEPSLSPDGAWVVYESHEIDVEGGGVVMISALDGRLAAAALTPEGEDCRQPNWSPDGARIVFQCLLDDQWALWTARPDGSDRRRLSTGDGDETDASWSPDGRWVVFSRDDEDSDAAALFIRPAEGGAARRATLPQAYDGAPSWSPDGRHIVFEASDDPDLPSTTIWTIAAPAPR